MGLESWWQGPIATESSCQLKNIILRHKLDYVNQVLLESPNNRIRFLALSSLCNFAPQYLFFAHLNWTVLCSLCLCDCSLCLDKCMSSTAWIGSLFIHYPETCSQTEKKLRISGYVLLFQRIEAAFLRPTEDHPFQIQLWENQMPLTVLSICSHINISTYKYITELKIITL